jgi:hypothetical protein
MGESNTRASALYMAGQVDDAARSGGGIEGKGSLYHIRGDDRRTYVCDYTDLVTEGFRTLLIGDVVRFVPDDDGIDLRALQVLKLQEPTTDEYYSEGVEPAPFVG